MSLSAVCSNSTKDWLPCARFVCFCSVNTPIHTHTNSQIAYHFSLYSFRFLTLMMIYQLLLSWILLLLCTGVWKIIVQLVEVLYVAISYLPSPPSRLSTLLAVFSNLFIRLEKLLRWWPTFLIRFLYTFCQVLLLQLRYLSWSQFGIKSGSLCNQNQWPKTYPQKFTK